MDRHQAIRNTHPNVVTVDDGLGAFDKDGNSVTIDEDKVSQEIQKFQSAEPMRLLREERNRRIAKTDWRFRSDLSPSQEWKDYCVALRDLPANYSPTFDIMTEDDYPLVKEDNTTPWPEEPTDG